VSPNHPELEQHLGQGRGELSWLQTAAGVSQALVALVEQPMPSPYERFVMQLRSAEEVKFIPSRPGQRETPACEMIPRSPRESPLLAGLLH